MRLLFNADVFGWRMTGLLGKGAKWFFGYSNNHRTENAIYQLTELRSKVDKHKRSIKIISKILTYYFGLPYDDSEKIVNGKEGE